MICVALGFLTRLSIAPVNKLLNVVSPCEIRGRLRCIGASIRYRVRISGARYQLRMSKGVLAAPFARHHGAGVFGRPAQGIIQQMAVTCRRLRLGVAKQGADNG